MNVIQISTASNVATAKDKAVVAKYKNIVVDRKLAVRRNGFLEFYISAVRCGLTPLEMYSHLGYASLPYESLEIQAINRKIDDLKYNFDLDKEFISRYNGLETFVAIA